ncbi:ABC transporter ATP-binding protein [Loktanella sp. DJP18]|uniref:ABC transporter ATP-binding protein n=1 Tax=Loktanella sp. DJP18 TaxID=3409788 RepID=UPI003BB79E92
MTAIDDVTLDIPDGSFVCLLGPSGCGKTTLLRLMAGLEVPSAGRILVAGEDQTDVPSEKRGFGMVFQSLALFPHLNVAQNVAYPLTIRGRPKAEARARAEELLALVQLDGVAERRIHQLSGGQRQRVAIARGLAINPRVFLLDEPLSALDANLREHMQVELRQLQQRLGVTTVCVTHDQKEALTMADQVIVMEQGRVQQIGAPMQVYRNPANAFVAGFIGTSALIPCRVIAERTIEIAGRRLTVHPNDRVNCAVGANAVLSVRPEDVRLTGTGSASNDAPDVHMSARIVFVRDLGESVHYVLELNGQEITALYHPSARPDVTSGDVVGMTFAPGSCTVLPA